VTSVRMSEYLANEHSKGEFITTVRQMTEMCQ